MALCGGRHSLYNRTIIIIPLLATLSQVSFNSSSNAREVIELKLRQAKKCLSRAKRSALNRHKAPFASFWARSASGDESQREEPRGRVSSELRKAKRKKEEGKERPVEWLSWLDVATEAPPLEQAEMKLELSLACSGGQKGRSSAYA